MRQLTSVDAQFLALENRRQYGHVSGLAILDPSTAPGGKIELADEPRFARTYLLEIHAAGAGAQAERDAALQRFAGRYRTSFDAALRDRPDRSMPSDESLFILAAGVDGLVCARVRVGAVERLPELEDELTFTAVALLEGAAAARADGPPAAGDASHDRRGP